MAFVTVKEMDSIKTDEGYLTKVQVEISGSYGGIREKLEELAEKGVRLPSSPIMTRFLGEDNSIVKKTYETYFSTRELIKINCVSDLRQTRPIEAPLRRDRTMIHGIEYELEPDPNTGNPAPLMGHCGQPLFRRDPNTGHPIPEWVKTQPEYDPNNFPLA